MAVRRLASTRSVCFGFPAGRCKRRCDWLDGFDAAVRGAPMEPPTAVMPAAQSAHQCCLEARGRLERALTARESARRPRPRALWSHVSLLAAGRSATTRWVTGARPCRCGRAGAASAAERNDCSVSRPGCRTSCMVADASGVCDLRRACSRCDAFWPWCRGARDERTCSPCLPKWPGLRGKTGAVCGLGLEVPKCLAWMAHGTPV